MNLDGNLRLADTRLGMTAGHQPVASDAATIATPSSSAG